MNFEIVKGSYDFSPKEMILINSTLDIIKQNFEKYGFRPFDTPIMEYYKTLAGKYDKDSEILDEIYKLSDRGNRELGLRYDLTQPLCRYISNQKQLKLPFRRYCIGKVFRDGPIKPGRSREFIQCDGDVIGICGNNIEAELLDLFYKTYNELQIKSIIEINNIKILKGALLQANFKEEDLSTLILSIDKLKKIGKEAVILEIKNKGYDENKINLVIDILNSISIEEIKKISTNQLLLEGIFELENLIKLIDDLNINYRINFSMARGLDIYTGNIWEAYQANNKIKSSIGSGGRYDKIIGDFISTGKQYPAVGISFGLVPIISCLDNLNLKESNTDILLIPLNESLVSQAFKIANNLREDGKNIEINYSFKLKKAFNYADYLGVNSVIIFGENDLKSNQYSIKNLKTKKEKKIPFKFS